MTLSEKRYIVAKRDRTKSTEPCGNRMQVPRRPRRSLQRRRAEWRVACGQDNSLPLRP
jgi:hypothetical protein